MRCWAVRTILWQAAFGLAAVLATSCGSAPEPPAEPSPPAVAPPDAPPEAPTEVSPAPPVAEGCVVPRPAPDLRARTLEYSRPGGAPLSLDLASPRGAGPHPFVVLIHGGGWTAGERSHLRQEILSLATIGYAAASIDYRLLSGGRHLFPAAIADARCAVRYLRSHADELDLDPARAGAVGFSAGAHLALLLAVAADAAELDEGCADTETSPAVQVAVGYYAPTDFRAAAVYSPAAERIIERLLGAPRQRRPELAALASPLAHVDGSEPPVLLVHGSADRTVPVAQSRAMRDALAAVDAPVRYVEIEGAGHGVRLLSRNERDREATCASLEMLRDILRPAPPPPPPPSVAPRRRAPRGRPR